MPASACPTGSGRSLAHWPHLRLGAFGGRQSTPEACYPTLNPDPGAQSLEYPPPSHESCPRSPYHSSRSPPTTSHSGHAIEGAIRASVALLQFLPRPRRPPVTSVSLIPKPYMGVSVRHSTTYWRRLPTSNLAPAPGHESSRGKARAALSEVPQGNTVRAAPCTEGQPPLGHLRPA